MSGKSRKRNPSPLGGRLDYARRQFPNYMASGAVCDVPDCGVKAEWERALTWYDEDGVPFTVLIKLCRTHGTASFTELQQLLPALVEVFGDDVAGYMDLREGAED